MDFSTSFDPDEYLDSEMHSNTVPDELYPGSALVDVPMQLSNFQDSPPRSRLGLSQETTDLPRLELPRSHRSLSVNGLTNFRSVSQHRDTAGPARSASVTPLGTGRPMAPIGYSRQFSVFSNVLANVQRTQRQMKQVMEEHAKSMKVLEQTVQAHESTMTKLNNDMVALNKQANHLQDFVTAFQEDIDRANQQSESNLLSNGSISNGSDGRHARGPPIARGHHQSLAPEQQQSWLAA